jgi:hypothetical protein
MKFRRCRIKGRQKLSSVAGLLLALGLAAGCRLDMHDQPRFKPLRMSDFYADLRSSRPLEPGTIARGELRADSYFYSGMINGNPGDEMPFPATKEVLYRRPPSYHIDRLRNAPLGHFFDVITNGFGAMPDYAEQIPARDRWAIIAYIRALQLSQQAPLSIVPPADRDRMLSQPPQPPATPGTGATMPGGAAGQGVQK